MQSFGLAVQLSGGYSASSRLGSKDGQSAEAREREVCSVSSCRQAEEQLLQVESHGGERGPDEEPDSELVQLEQASLDFL